MLRTPRLASSLTRWKTPKTRRVVTLSAHLIAAAPWHAERRLWRAVWLAQVAPSAMRARRKESHQPCDAFVGKILRAPPGAFLRQAAERAASLEAGGGEGNGGAERPPVLPLAIVILVAGTRGEPPLRRRMRSAQHYKCGQQRGPEVTAAYLCASWAELGNGSILLSRGGIL